MNQDYIWIVIDNTGANTLLKGTKIGLLHLRGKAVFLTLQQVVKVLGTFKILLASPNDLPLRLYTQVVQKWDRAIKNLGYASAHSGGI